MRDETPRRRRYRQAATTYVVLGLAVMALTLAGPELLDPERRAEVARLGIGVAFFLVFGAFISRGDRWIARTADALGSLPDSSRALGEWIQEKVTMVLTVTALLRAAIFAAAAAGRRPRLGFSPFVFRLETMEAGEPRMAINAALMALIAIFLFRASWMAFGRRLAGPRRNPP